MLPATLAHNVKRQVQHYLEATFNFRKPDEEAALREFINHPVNGLFKGPWVQVRRPFRPAADSGTQYFEIEPPFLPFRHQWLAWRNLTSKGQSPRSTIITTGTGSGKTECFLFPLLDHCRREIEAGRKGIKAIVMYPMNALAADQAGRFAEEVFNRPGLYAGSGLGRKALVRIGLYTGRSNPAKPGGSDSGAVKAMMVTAEAGGGEVYGCITDHEAMQQDPPDILLTNYKMLDYLLIRPKDQEIWRFNEPGRLRYLALDELHTYDGAQGADVACLIRRLKERLDIPRGGLCCIGTSATIAGGDDEKHMDPLQRLAEFAGTLFEETFTPSDIITEDRLTVPEIVDVNRHSPDSLPSAAGCTPLDGETAGEFARRIAPLWGGPAFPLREGANRWMDRAVSKPTPEKYWGLELGAWLKRQQVFCDLLEATVQPVLTWEELVDRLSANYALRKAGDKSERSLVLAAFFALVAEARELRSGRALPLAPTQLQLWIRELRRLGRVVDEKPRFGWLDEPQTGDAILPVAHCTECGEAVWVALIDRDSEAEIQAKGVYGFRLKTDASRIYKSWGFEGVQSPDIVVMSPWPDDEDFGGQGELEHRHFYLSKESLIVRRGPGLCPLTEARTFRVKLNKDTHQREDGRLLGRVKCPHCDSAGSLMFIGTQASTISSVAIDEVFGSVLNNDPKLLAFTDSVQDASHRAGFFSARTYHFTFRTGLQRVIDEAGAEGLPLTEAGDRLLEYWSEQAPGRPGSPCETMATLLPPDLREYKPYLDYRNEGPPGAPPSPRLRAEFAERLTWEATSEFSLMLTHGRTLELNASACLGWDEEVIDETVARLLSRLPRIDTTFEQLAPDRLRLWIYGFLHRCRERGTLSHNFVSKFASSGLWGKRSRRQVLKGRETFPPHGRYRPRLIVTAPDNRHDCVLTLPAPGSARPWQVEWARRALARTGGLAGTSEIAIVDLIRMLLTVGSETGLFEEAHKDGSKTFYALSARAARLYADGYQFACSHSGHRLYRPAPESAYWDDAPSLSYGSKYGRYEPAELTERQAYYRQRYHKGALRRVFAQEHTGLLTTEEREELERRFNGSHHADDPNVITATSTLEMGIDIGDLSTTMLCSVPPTTASYLQRIGRAGRTTGTALVLSVINQRPHDLFFYARPEAMLAGKIEPPGCWLDASAMLVRQYLAFCLDSAVKEQVIDRLPASGKQLADDMELGGGPIITLLDWMTAHEAALQERFLSRFALEVRDDTRNRFSVDAQASD